METQTHSPAQVEPEQTEQFDRAALQALVDEWFLPLERRMDAYIAKLDSLIICKDGEAA